MSVIVKNGSQYRMITKGALEEIIKSCTKVKRNGQLEKITQEKQQNWLNFTKNLHNNSYIK